MASEHLSPRDATVKAMGEIQSALLGITLVLVAVFLPMASSRDLQAESTGSSR